MPDQKLPARQLSREVRLKSRPAGMPSEDNFELADVPVPAPAEGEFLARNLWMSVDPYMRGRMKPGRGSYVEPFEVGKPLDGGCVARVVQSRHPAFREGDYVLGALGWRDYWVSDGTGVQKIDPEAAPIQAFLGVLGMPGLTAYAGLLRIAEFQSGQTLFVSGAAGAVGSVVCQIGKLKGGRVIASAGSDEKVAWLRNEAGVDHAINYRRTESLLEELRRAAPDGLDAYFDNVGGDHLDAALRHMKVFGRIAVCGMISAYNLDMPSPAPRNLFMLIVRRVRMQGFLVHDHKDLLPAFLTDMGRWIAEGRLKWKETVVDGLENAPAAFIGLFHGENLGKMLVRVAADDA